MGRHCYGWEDALAVWSNSGASAVCAGLLFIEQEREARVRRQLNREFDTMLGKAREQARAEVVEQTSSNVHADSARCSAHYDLSSSIRAYLPIFSDRRRSQANLGG